MPNPAAAYPIALRHSGFGFLLSFVICSFVIHYFAPMSSGRKQYPFHLIEPKWQKVWDEQQTFRAWNPGDVIPQGHPFARRHDL
jgi:hypothetical protein